MICLIDVTIKAKMNDQNFRMILHKHGNEEKGPTVWPVSPKMGRHFLFLSVKNFVTRPNFISQRLSHTNAVGGSDDES